GNRLRRQRPPGGRRGCAPRAGRAHRLRQPRARRGPGRAGHGARVVALLEPDVHAIAPPAPEPAADRAPDRLAAGTPEPLRGDLVALVGAEQVLTRASDLIRYASDASPYRRFPQAVVMARDT